MLPTDILSAAKAAYNAVGDSFFSDSQIYNWTTQACNELAKKAFLIEQLYTTTTVAGQQSYNYPTDTIGLKRITVNGKKIKRITMRDDDAITLSNQQVTTQGWPIYYTDFDYTINLRPIPDASNYTLNIYSYNLHDPITATSSLEIPQLFHFDLVDYVLMRMYSQDKDFTSAAFYLNEWLRHVKDAIAYKQKLKRSDSFATIQSEDILPVTILGEA